MASCHLNWTAIHKISIWKNPTGKKNKTNKQQQQQKKLYENHDYLNSTVYLKVTRITLSINQNLNNLNFFTGITDWTFF